MSLSRLANAFAPASHDHAVYAVLDTIHGPHRVRVSAPLTWNAAQDSHLALHQTDGTYDRPVVFPGYEVYGRPVKFFAVRATNDPQWPADKPVLTVNKASA